MRFVLTARLRMICSSELGSISVHQSSGASSRFSSIDVRIVRRSNLSTCETASFRSTF